MWEILCSFEQGFQAVDLDYLSHKQYIVLHYHNRWFVAPPWIISPVARKLLNGEWSNVKVLRLDKYPIPIGMKVIWTRWHTWSYTGYHTYEGTQCRLQCHWQDRGVWSWCVTLWQRMDNCQTKTGDCLLPEFWGDEAQTNQEPYPSGKKVCSVRGHLFPTPDILPSCIALWCQIHTVHHYLMLVHVMRTMDSIVLCCSYIPITLPCS